MSEITSLLKFLYQKFSPQSDREYSIILHNFVRDNIQFGFTIQFEQAHPDITLSLKRGHCNVQAELLRTLLATVGIPARLRYVQLDKNVLRYAVPWPVFLCLPKTLFHALTQIKIADAWLNTDSYIFDPITFQRQQQRLLESGLDQGYGTTKEATNIWDGTKDAFSQARIRDLHKDNLIADKLLEGNNKLLGIHFNKWLSLIPKFLSRGCENFLNSHLN